MISYDLLRSLRTLLLGRGIRLVYLTPCISASVSKKLSVGILIKFEWVAGIDLASLVRSAGN